MQQDYYWDDFEQGMSFTSPSRVLTERDIVDFAMTYDPQPFHLDRHAAEASHFGKLVAGGFQTAALAWALAQQTAVFAKCSIAGIGVDKLRWTRPAQAGDTLTCRFQLLNKRASSSRPGQGVAEWRFDILNQDGDVVLTMQMTQLLKCRLSRGAID